MTITFFSFGTSLLRAGLPMVLGMLSLSAAAQTPPRSAFDILEVGRWSNPPTKTNPLAAHHTYHSAAMNVDVGYTIYLPPGYATNSVRYPVVYWLPGGGCNEEPDSPSIAQGLLGGIDAAIRTGKLPPLIFVIVNGGRYTRYYDSVDGSIMMETTVIRELIPHIDATYRTVAARDGRAIQGGSMGGMGSLKFAFKYPELFSSAVAFCPALLDADANMKRNPTLIPALFNGDKTLFTKDSPAAMLVTNADNIRGRLAIKIVIGSEDGLLEWSEKLHASMVKLKISHELEIVGGVGHDFGPKGIYEHQLRALRYAADHFAMPRTLRFLWLSCAAFVLVSRGTCAGDYVADTQIQHASDEGTGTAKLPLKTMAKAADLARADTHTAASGASADVQAAINAAQDGDTVVIPAGTYTWTTRVEVSTPKAITIRGAGIDQTIIIDNLNKSGGREATVLLPINLALGKRFRLTGMTFRGMAQDTEVYNKGTVTVAGNAQDFRLDHLKFDKPGTSAIRYYGTLYGVVDHCVFDLSNGKQGNVIWHEKWGGHEYGDGSFAEPLALGTEKAIYLEDNAFIGSGVAGAGVVDSMGGGRFAFRHNSVTDDNLAAHGTESTGRFRGVRSYEIYDNVFTTSRFLFCGIYLRGGTGVIFNNTFRGTGGQSGYKIGILTANYRSDRAYMPWGMATGTNPWDGNQDSSGYPCLDQVGWGTCDLLSRDPNPPASWPHQSSEPLYLWNNNWTPVPNNPGGVVGSQHAVIRENRDYFNNTSKPGYTPYTYPHPLVTEGIR